MSQISPPIRILLVAAVAFMAAWVLFLRPQAEEVPPPPAASAPATQPGATAQSKPGKAAQAAANARAQVDAKTQAAEAGEQAPAAAPATAAAPAAAAQPGAKPAPKPADPTAKAATGLPLRVLKALSDRKVIALLFWNPKSSDDRAVRRALGDIDRHKGKVLAHAAHVKRIAAYAQITRGAKVEQSPTVVVVDRDRKVVSLVGYVDRGTIDQAVEDSLR